MRLLIRYIFDNYLYMNKKKREPVYPDVVVKKKF